MKSAFLKSFISLFFIVISSSVYAQRIDIPDYDWDKPDLSYNCLGLHCYVSVDLKNDPVENGYYKYTIPIPREGVDFISGPVGCYLSNNLGSTVDIYIRRSHFEVIASDQPHAQVPFELFVPLWKDYSGLPTTTPSGVANQCYYHVVFNMNEN